MPIYEFYCPDCHTVYSFFSRAVNTSKRPKCPRCPRKALERQVSSFAVTGGGWREDGDDAMDEFPVDEGKMERALSELSSEAEHIREDDPRAAAQLMRKFSKMTGMEFGEGMEEALHRLEGGEDPEAVEADLGDVMEREDPFVTAGNALKKNPHNQAVPRRGVLRRDPKFYEL